MADGRREEEGRRKDEGKRMNYEFTNPNSRLLTPQPVDLLILANGPGEVTTWVRPVVKALRQRLGDDRTQLRISIVLSPCPHATGKEAAIARSYPEVDRVQPPAYFVSFLLWGKTQENWDWRKKGAVIFLGGDQAYAVILGKRLGYRTIVYAEWEARWYQWVDEFCLRQPSIIAKVPSKYRYKLTVIGDLMADVVEGRRQEGSQKSKVKSECVIPPPSPLQDKQKEEKKESEVQENSSLGSSPSFSLSPSPPLPLIGFLPGSKAAKLTQGVPLCVAIAQYLYEKRPQIRFMLPVAPTLDLPTLANYADRDRNPILSKMGNVSAKLVNSESSVLQTETGVQIELITQFPAHEYLCQCHLVLTTVGANTAELGALGVPMLVLLPTQQLDAMRTWDGIPGLLANLPLLGATFAKGINWAILKKGRLFAWPNIWAQEQIVPELVGELQASQIAQIVLDYLNHPEKLAQMRERLLEIRGRSGASEQIARVVERQLNEKALR